MYNIQQEKHKLKIYQYCPRQCYFQVTIHYKHCRRVYAVPSTMTYFCGICHQAMELFKDFLAVQFISVNLRPVQYNKVICECIMYEFVKTVDNTTIFLIIAYFQTVIQLHNFTLLFIPSIYSSIVFLFLFQIHGLNSHQLMLHTYTRTRTHIYICKTCLVYIILHVRMFSGLTVGYCTINWCTFPNGRLFLRLSTFLRCLQFFVQG